MSTTATIKPLEAVFSLSTQIERTPLLAQKVVSIEPKKSQSFLMAFPAKADFIDADWLKVEIPIYSEGEEKSQCRVTAKFERDISQPIAYSATSDRSNFVYSFYIGTPVLASGDQALLGSSYGALGMSMDIYPKGKHGAYVGFLVDGFGSPDFNYLSPVEDLNTSAKHMTTSGFLASGYSGRFPISPNFAWTYQVGPAFYFFEVSALEKSGSAYRMTGFAAHQQLGLNWHVRSPVGNTVEMNAAIYDIWIPSAKYGALSASGNRLGVLVGFGIGL